MDWITSWAAAVWHKILSPPTRTRVLSFEGNERHYITRRVSIPDLSPPPIPFDGVPDELIAEIFIHCLDLASAAPLKEKAPMLVAQVCRRWRSVTLSSPRLWSYIDVVCAQDSCFINPLLLGSWLNRSRGTLLTISFEVVIAGPDAITPPERFTRKVEVLLRSLLEHFERWERCHILIPQSLHRFLHLLPNDKAPFLESLSVDIPSLEIFVPTTTDDLKRLQGPLLNTTPSLRHLAWQFRHAICLPLLCDVPWYQIMDLALESRMSALDCYTILTRSPVLETCYFANVSQIPFYNNELGGLTLSHLQSLRIETSVSILHLLQSLTLPRLTSLIIEATGTRASALMYDTCELPGLLLRSKAQLTKLTLENFQIEESELVQCLALSPSLVQLEVIEETGETARPLTDRLINALADAYEDTSAFLCPNLEVIRFMGRVSSTDGNFARMVQNRWNESAVANGVACLKMAHVEFDDAAHVEDMSRLQMLRSEGLLARAFS